MKKRLTSLLLLFIFSVSALTALSVETIYYAPSSSLRSMAESRSLSPEGTDDEIRKRLYDYYGFEEYSLEIGNEEGNEDKKESYTLSISSAETADASGSVFTLDGSVVIDFTSKDTPSRTLCASRVVVDTERKILTALGNARYTNSDSEAAIKEIEADILTVSWENMNILITDGTTTSERENSEKKKVTFSTSGERLRYLTEGSIIFEEGRITSNPENAYSSISADSILILPGEDMFIAGATFNIGRVPIFFLPFFFFPGSRILGNPSFGFNSAKGAFLNTTFEIFGSYPKIESQDESSSFSSLLKSSEDDSSTLPRGYYYSSDDVLSPLEKFAQSTSSYLAVMADFYKGGSSASELKNGGMHLAFDSSLNLFDKKLKLSLSSGVATPRSTSSNNLRYYGNNTLSFSSWGLTLSMKFPYYSDRTVLYDYGNRLTGFSYGPLLGEESSFPEDYSSSGITSFTRSFSLSYTLPQSIKIPFVSSFSVKNLSVDGNYSIRELTAGKSSEEKASVLSSYTLPSLSLSLSGTIFSFDTSKKKAESSSSSEATKQSDEEILKSSDSLEKKLLMSEYTIEKSQRKASESEKTKLALSYTLSEDLSDKRENNTSTGEKKSGVLTNTAYSRFLLEGNIANIITLSNVFTATYSYSDTTDYTSSVNTRKTTLNPLNTLKLSLPLLGLTYNLAVKPFDYSSKETGDDGKTETWEKAVFTKDYVKTHSIVFSKSFETALGVFTGELTYKLPPLDSSLTPLLKWAKSGLTLTLQMLFNNNDGVYEHDNVKMTLNYSSVHFSTQAVLNYQTNGIGKETDYLEPLTLTHSASLKTKDGMYALEESLKGDGGTEGFFTELKTTLKLGVITGTVTYTSDGVTLSFESVNIKTNITGKSFQLWKGRIYLSFALDSSILLNHRDRAKSYLTVTPSMTFSIAEFLDFKFSFRTQNNRLGTYYENDSFSFPLLWEDAMRSIDFFGNGRKNTSFIMQSVSLDIIHYMEDWNLNIKYTTSFSKGRANGKTVYSLKPTLSVYLQWNTMPDLKAEENWTKGDDGNWKRK